MTRLGESPEIQKSRKEQTYVPYRAHISREPFGFSIEDMEQTSILFEDQPVEFVKKVHHELTIVSPIEIYQAVHRSKKYDDSDMRTVSYALFNTFNADSRQRAYAGVEGIDQFGEWISVVLDDVVYQDERERIQEELRRITNVYVNFQTRQPHISLAKGAMARLSNLDAIQDSLPPVIEFGAPKLYTKETKYN